MTMDTDFAIESHSGFLPCTYAGAPAGFEYFFSTVAEMELEPGNVTAAIGDRDVGISLVTHASMRELATAVIAAAVLCTIADGVVQDEESGEITDAEAALADARAILSELGDDLG